MTSNFQTRYNYLVMAIILSSFGKVFVFLMIIWNYDHYWINFFLIELFVFTSNVLAVRGLSFLKETIPNFKSIFKQMAFSFFK